MTKCSPKVTVQKLSCNRRTKQMHRAELGRWDWGKGCKQFYGNYRLWPSLLVSDFTLWFSCLLSIPSHRFFQEVGNCQKVARNNASLSENNFVKLPSIICIEWIIPMNQDKNTVSPFKSHHCFSVHQQQWLTAQKEFLLIRICLE